MILIRHGQTQWNLEKRYMGSADLELTETGKKQAKAVFCKMNTRVVHRVYSSNKKRATVFAGIAFPNHTIIKTPALREMDFGIFEGKTYAGLMSEYPELYSAWLKNPFMISIPGGEHPDKFKKRLIKKVNSIIADNPGKTCAVISHGGCISIIISHLLKTKITWDLIPGLGSVIVLKRKNRKWTKKTYG